MAIVCWRRGVAVGGIEQIIRLGQAFGHEPLGPPLLWLDCKSIETVEIECQRRLGARIAVVVNIFRKMQTWP